MASASVENAPRIDGIESLRGFAATYVFAAHIAVLFAIAGPSTALFFKFGTEAVMLFFVVSGFVVMFSVQRTGISSYGAYFRKRFTRIYPLFLLSLLVAQILTWAQGVDWRALLGNIAMLQDYAQGRPGTIVPTYRNSPLWSLSYEWWFYQLFWPIYRFVPRNRQLQLVTAVGIAATWCYFVVKFQPLLFIALFPTWWWGAELSRDLLDGEIRWQRILVAASISTASFGATIIATLAMQGHVSLVDDPTFEFRQSLDVLAYLGIAALFGWARTMGSLNRVSVFRRLAPISYGIYALHYPLVIFAGSLGLSGWTAALCCVPATLALAAFAELVFQPWAKRLLDALVFRPERKEGLRSAH